MMVEGSDSCLRNFVQGFLGFGEELAALKNSEAKEIIALAKKRKALKVPDMEESDLIMEHSLTNSKGQSIKAKFIVHLKVK